MLQSQPPPNTVQRSSQDAEGLGEVVIGEGGGWGGAGQVGDSARTEGTTEREGTDGTTRVAGRDGHRKTCVGGGLEAGQTQVARLWETLVGLQYRDPNRPERNPDILGPTRNPPA
jgi:hypothetical protein